MQAATALFHHEATFCAIFGRKEALIDSPVLNHLIAEKVAEGKIQVIQEATLPSFFLPASLPFNPPPAAVPSRVQVPDPPRELRSWEDRAWGAQVVVDGKLSA